MKRLILISRCKLRLRHTLVRLMWIFIAFFAFYHGLVFCWSIAFWKDYKSQEIYIPQTKEKLYLITFKSRMEADVDWVELSMCDWRIFHSREREYWFRKEVYSQSTYINTPIYYKVSNDTLYLLVQSPTSRPKKFRSKAEIKQIPIGLFETSRTFRGALSFPDDPAYKIAKEDLENEGYKKFP